MHHSSGGWWCSLDRTSTNDSVCGKHQSKPFYRIYSILSEFWMTPDDSSSVIGSVTDQIEDRSSINICAASQRSLCEGTGQHEASSWSDEVHQWSTSTWSTFCYRRLCAVKHKTFEAWRICQVTAQVRRSISDTGTHWQHCLSIGPTCILEDSFSVSCFAP